jgi:hypothetical protein
MRLHARILCGLTFATAGHLHAHDHASQQSDSPQIHDRAHSSLTANQPAAQQTSDSDDTQQIQSTSQEILPASQQDQTPAPQDPTAEQRSESTVPETPPSLADRPPWLDRTRQTVYDALWHSAMRVDRWFGSTEEEAEYRKVYGSIAPAVLWDQHYGFSTPFRFNVNLPLPRIDQRFHAFVGRFDPNEVVTESAEPSGAFRRQYGPSTEDQTLFGLAFHQPSRQGGYFDAGAGMRVSFPLDPYLKGSYVYDRGASERGLLSLRETAFWQNTQGFGVTSRADIERIYNLRWFARWTGSVTFSQKSRGVLGWSAIDLMRGFASRRAIALELEIDGQTDAPVPIHNYGTKFAYRQAVLRKWLIMELRTSVSWPKDLPSQDRRLSPGVGMGLEMLFGTDEFRARPVTF